nr:MAG TPA: hypothetical protein [Caudoviricetes sp.]
MKKSNIPVRHRAYNPNKGYNYAQHKGRLLFMTIMMVMGIISLLQMLNDPSSPMDMGGTGVSMAAFAALTAIDDVTDRDTHGSALAYKVVLVPIALVDGTKAFPQPDKDRKVKAIPFKAAAELKAFVFDAHDIPTFTATTEKGDITTSGENNIVIVMGGTRVELYNFIEQYAGGKFIILYKHIKETQWYILGEPERPMILNNTETKDDKDGRYSTFTFKRTSVDLPCLYAEDPLGVTATEESRTSSDTGQSVASSPTTKNKLS